MRLLSRVQQLVVMCPGAVAHARNFQTSELCLSGRTAASEGVFRGGDREDEVRRLCEHNPALPLQPDPLPPGTGHLLLLLDCNCAGLLVRRY